MFKKVLLVCLTVLWMTSIFIFSNQKSTQSTNRSHSLITNTIVRIYKLFDNNPSDEKIENIIDTWDVPVRKIAHFTEYFILGILIFLTLREFKINNVYLAILLCYIYSCSDEFHQLFVIGRDGNLVDIILDTIGSITGILIVKKLEERH